MNLQQVVQDNNTLGASWCTGSDLSALEWPWQFTDVSRKDGISVDLRRRVSRPLVLMPVSLRAGTNIIIIKHARLRTSEGACNPGAVRGVYVYA